jgi:hypothetical protein
MAEREREHAGARDEGPEAHEGDRGQEPVVLLLERQERERDGGKPELGEHVPGPGQRGGQADAGAGEPPAAQDAEGHGRVDRVSRRRDVRRRRRRLGHHERAAHAKSGDGSRPGKRVGREVDARDRAERRALLPGELLQHLPHRVVVGESRQDERKDTARPSGLHGKEGVNGSSPLVGFLRCTGV